MQWETEILELWDSYYEGKKYRAKKADWIVNKWLGREERKISFLDWTKYVISTETKRLFIYAFRLKIPRTSKIKPSSDF